MGTLASAIGLAHWAQSRVRESRRLKHEREYDHALAGYSKLRKTNPVAALESLHEAFERRRGQEKEYRAILNAKAPVDGGASRELAGRLSDDLAATKRFREWLKKQPPSDRIAKELEELDEADAKTRVELEHVRSMQHAWRLANHGL